MIQRGSPTFLRLVLAETLDEALGRSHRDDPSAPRTGGPAGNALLTAWTGLLLLVLSSAELITLIDVGGLISWHIVLGTLLVPPALLKTASTGWRIARYYRRSGPYRHAGPPPMPLRILGPTVVASTLGLLGSGLVLVLLGEDNSRTVLITALGQRVDWLTLHQGLFIAWAVLTGLHVVARTVPALELTVLRRRTMKPVDGTTARTAILAGCIVVGAVAAVLVLLVSGAWHRDDRPGPQRRTSPFCSTPIHRPISAAPLATSFQLCRFRRREGPRSGSRGCLLAGWVAQGPAREHPS